MSDYHISLKSDGKDINLYDDIMVSIPCDNPDCKVLAVKDWETQTDMNATYENGVYTFKTNHLPAEFAVVLKTTEDNSEPEQSSENEPSKTTENSSAQQTSENKGTTDTSNTGISDTSASDLPTTADSVLPAVIVALLAAISGITAFITIKCKHRKKEQ
ncbi:MAG: hypothetical protein PUG48_07475 [Clostridia bacterium]|nr:hypothetical protein [Clostridia bacterium]